MRMLRLGVWPVVALLTCIGLANSALAQLTDEDITALQSRGRAEGWTFEVGQNDATQLPLAQLCGMVAPPRWREAAHFENLDVQRSYPARFDWRDFACCTPVRNQGGCGSCWAFGTVGPLEGNIMLYDGLDVDISEQWLVSCNRDGWSCGGGWWAHEYHQSKTDVCGGTGAVPESAFPYTGTDAACNCPYAHTWYITSWAFIGGYDIPSVESMKQALLDFGPISVCVTVDGAFQAYGQGIFNSCTSEPINHAVTLVGWNDADGGYWIMRNSWGAGWGEDGYMRIRYNCSSIGYAACYIKYKPYMICGRVLLADSSPAEGVTLLGLPRSPVTDSTGYYSTRVDANWSGTVTPSKPGWIFSPGTRAYSSVNSDRTNQDFVGTPPPYVVSGHVRKPTGEGLVNVLLAGLPGEPVTDINGFYSAGVPANWSGTVTPSRGGFAMEPMTRTYDNVTASQVEQDYTATPLTFALTGHVRTASGQPVARVKLEGLPGEPVTDADGYYVGDVLGGWSGTVQPDRFGSSFSPGGRVYGNVAGELHDQDYTATVSKVFVTGLVLDQAGQPLRGVVVEGLPGHYETFGDGHYFAWLNVGWSGTVGPVENCHVFGPASRTYINLTTDCLNDGYTGDSVIYTISGYVRNPLGVGLSDVLLSGLPNTPVTNSEGYYSAQADCGFSGPVAPIDYNYSFSPQQREYVDLMLNLVSQDYVGVPNVDCNGNGIADVRDISNGTSWDDNDNNVPDECELVPGDLNCDALVDFNDITPFVTAINGHAGYHAAFPGCLWLNGDLNTDGAVDFDDISPFVWALGH